MSELSYIDFDLTIEKSGEQYQARATSSSSAQAGVQFSKPMTDQDVELFVLRLGRARSRMRRIEGPEMQTAKKYGQSLFDAVFAGDIYASYYSGLALAQKDGKGLRIRFHYIGHGGFMDQTQDGVLLLEDEAQNSQYVNGEILGTLLHDERTLRQDAENL